MTALPHHRQARVRRRTTPRDDHPRATTEARTRKRGWRRTSALALALAAPLAHAEPPTAAPAPTEAPAPTDAAAALPTDPDALRQTGLDALRRRQRERAIECGEALIRGFPGTVHAVRGLDLIFAATARAEDAATLDAVEARLDVIAPPSATTDPKLRAEAAPLRGRIGIQRGQLAASRGRRGDLRGYDECLAIYRRLAAEVDDDDLGPIVLFNAARCAEPLHRIGEALALYQRIVDVYPDSELAERSLEALVELSLSLARFEQAATWMELHVERYPKSTRIHRHLTDALELRVALGEREAARALLQRYEQTYMRKDPERAAEAAWRVGAALATTDAERVTHAEAYLKRYGKLGGLDRRIVAEATITSITWDSSCPKGQTLGLCITPAPAPTARAKAGRCAATRTPTSRPRTRGPADAAQARFALIGKLSGQRITIPEDDLRRRRDYFDAVAASRIAALDRELEEFLTITPPTNLAFYVDPQAPDAARRAQREARETSARRLREYLDAKMTRATALSEGYASADRDKRSVHGTLAAAYRIGLIYEHVADQLWSAEIPRDVRTPKAREAHCAALEQQVATIRERAESAYLYCALRALEYAWPTDASQACDAALHRLKPREWPPLAEIVPEPAPWGELPPRAVGVQEDPPPDEADADDAP